MEILAALGMVSVVCWMMYLGKKQTDAKRYNYEFDPYGDIPSCSHMNPAYGHVMPLKHEVLVAPKPNPYKDIYKQKWKDN